MSCAPQIGRTTDNPNSRQRFVLVASLGAVAAVAWIFLWLGGHGAGGPGNALTPQVPLSGGSGFLLASLMWLVMMAAMMLPPLTPWLLLMASLEPSAGGRTRPMARVTQFGAGYFSIWLGYSLVAAALQIALQQGGLLGRDQRLDASIGGALLLAAALFQFSPFKKACLKHCRNPLGFFVARWHDGAPSPFRIGFHHGLYCLGCCWALMALSFALGLMNLLWMAVLTVMIVGETLAPRGEMLSRMFGVCLAGWGFWLLLGLT